MTSDEIKEIVADARTESQWLREIAYQLAVMNEQRKPTAPVPAVQPGKPIYQRQKQ